MLNLRKILSLFGYVRQLEKERDEYRDMFFGLDDKEVFGPISASAVVGDIIGRDIKWFDYQALPFGEKKKYYADIQSVLRNESLANEINHIIADTVEFIAKSAKDFNEVQMMRMQINALELLRERMMSIENPEKEILKDDINSVI